MKSNVTTRILALASFCLVSIFKPAQAATEPNLERMATCQDSWLDWKDDPTRIAKYADGLRTTYTGQADGYLVPKTKSSLFGLPVVGIYPQSIGMGVGFSVIVTGDFAAAKKAVEKAVGNSFKCESDSDNLHACQSELGPKKTVTVTSDADDRKTVLIGCFYFYEK
jgi:hypothetical protein